MTHPSATLAEPRRISPASLAPGDILLSKGIGEISDAICELDGGPYSHAAIWVDPVIESSSDGSVKISLEFAQGHREYIDVYRLKAERAKNALGAVVSAAEAYVGRPYGTSSLFLASAVFASVRLVPSDLARKAVLLLANEAVQLLTANAGSPSPSGEQPGLTCTELVVRSYCDGKLPLEIEAASDGRLDVIHQVNAWVGARKLLRRGTRGLAEPELGAQPLRRWELSALRAALGVQLDRTRAGDLRGSSSDDALLVDLERLQATLLGHYGSGLAETDLRGHLAGIAWAANLVTPHMLETSLDLERAGRVYERSGAHSF